MVQPTEDPEVALARRLRTLRKHHWSGRALTQGQLVKVLGAKSVALVSSWENLARPTPPPQRHLETYALFFATERSIEREPFRLLDITELTPAERAAHDQLLAELTALRTAARAGAPVTDSAEHTPWQFPLDQDITIVTSLVPAEELAAMPYADPQNPDYIESLRYADADALIELYGHIRATNPNNRVKYCTSAELQPSDYTAHLILIGGVDWNAVTEAVLRMIDIPVSQAKRENKTDDYGAFEVRTGDEVQLFRPTVVKTVVKKDELRILVEDVAHFYRAPNPYNSKRTVTILNGMFSRGTLGVVRALTDARFRSQNEAYIREQFAGSDTFSVLTRVPVVNGSVVTPDWTISENLLHEWSEVGVGGWRGDT